MKQQYNKLLFIKDKQINETTKQQYIWEKFLEPPFGKIMFFKEHLRKNSWSRHCRLRFTLKDRERRALKKRI